MQTTVYNQEGKEVRKISLPESIFGVKWNGDLVHQVVVSMQANAREHVAHVKMRGEVAGGGKKPWRQKGTGRARHGSTRSPIWVGGGVTHGPNPEKVYARKINRKMRAKALLSILSKKYSDGEVLFIDSFSVPSWKTKDALGVLQNLSKIRGFGGLLKKKENAALLALPKRDEKTALALRNISNIISDEVRNINPVSILSGKYLIVSDPESALSVMGNKAQKN